MSSSHIATVKKEKSGQVPTIPFDLLPNMRTHTHTQLYTHRDFTPQCTADLGCKLRLSCSWLSVFDSLLSLISLECSMMRAAGSTLGQPFTTPLLGTMIQPCLCIINCNLVHKACQAWDSSHVTAVFDRCPFKELEVLSRLNFKSNSVGNRTDKLLI